MDKAGNNASAQLDLLDSGDDLFAGCYSLKFVKPAPVANGSLRQRYFPVLAPADLWRTPDSASYDVPTNTSQEPHDAGTLRQMSQCCRTQPIQPPASEAISASLTVAVTPLSHLRNSTGH